MKVMDYIKERGTFFGFLLSAFLFACIVYRLDSGFRIRESNAGYILMGWGLLFLAFFIMDFYLFTSRNRKFEAYCRLNAASDPEEEFLYPVDRQNAALVRELAKEYEKYKAGVETKAAEEMEFITKWLHDVKVPIAAAKLILETQECNLPADFYQNIYSEIFHIEESAMRVFYEMKSNRFFDDYKISNTSTKRLVSAALKGYSNFFSYKKLGISVEGEEYQVLTDEKWSSYILSQIISNAVKYSPSGGSIVIHTKKDSTGVSISVRNSGKGIPEKDIGHIFQKGFTSSESRNGENATGYGLYLSKKLSDLLGHSLTAESKPNDYTVFQLTFHDQDTLLNVTKM